MASVLICESWWNIPLQRYKWYDCTGYDLRIISYDDGPDDYPPEVYQEIAKYPHLIYIVG